MSEPLPKEVLERPTSHLPVTPTKASQRALSSVRGIESIDGIAVDPPGELRDERASVDGRDSAGGPEHGQSATQVQHQGSEAITEAVREPWGEPEAICPGTGDPDFHTVVLGPSVGS